MKRKFAMMVLVATMAASMMTGVVQSQITQEQHSRKKLHSRKELQQRDSLKRHLLLPEH